MTSLATLILKLSQLTKQSEFYLSQYLRALIHLPRVWRILHADLHLTALTVTVLQLTRQLRMSSLIIIGAPPLLKLTSQTPELKSEEQIQPSMAALPLDLTTLQNPLDALQERALESPKPFQAITRTLFQTAPRVERALPSQTYSTTTSQVPDRAIIQESHHERLPTSPKLEDEGSAEESLREDVVERWLQQQEETGGRPMMSFAEAHKLYRDLFEEFVATSTLPPNLFADRFLQTPTNLTLDQAKTDLRVRLNTLIRTETESSYAKDQTETMKPAPSILLPSYVTSTLWAKGSLAFGGPTPTISNLILGITPSSPEVSNRPTLPISSERIRTNEALPTQASDKPSSYQPPANEPMDSLERVSNELSISQDRMTNEAFLGTPRKKVSPTQHTPLPENQNYPYDSTITSSEANPIETKTTEKLLEKKTLAEDTLVARESASTTPSSENRHLIPSPYEPEQNLRVYSPAAALYTTLAIHARTAFISPTRGNGHTSSPTIHTSPLKPPFAIVRDLKPVAFTEINLHLPQREGVLTERLESILPIVESHPTPIYLRPPMNLPAVESIIPQRTPASTLPSPNVAPTRETLAKLNLDEDEEEEENGEPEGYPEMEEEEADAAIREQLKRFGKIIAEEARRHIGST